MNDTSQPPASAAASAADGVGSATHLFFLLCVLLCAAFAGWAYFGRLDVVSVATGEVVPSSQVKSVQHLEGGIVREILVREGQAVTQGQPLVVLESTASGADVGELKINVTSLRVDVARLDAELDRRERPTFDADLEAAYPALVRQAIELFNARRNRQQSQVAGQREAIVQREQDINEISARLRNAKNSLVLLQEQIAISDELMKQDLTNRYNHLNLLKDASQLQGRVEEDTAALQRSRAALKEAQSALERITTTFIEEARQERDEKSRRLRELSQRLEKYEDSLKRTTLRSPVDGVVKTLSVATQGGVLKAGETVVEIVPAGDRLVIEARLPIQDIGYVKAGQKARIRLASPDAVRFEALDGVVTVVSPDTLVTEKGYAFYKVRVETERGYFERGPMHYLLYPGVQVMTIILIGQRSVLEYLLTPYFNAMNTALQER